MNQPPDKASWRSALDPLIIAIGVAVLALDQWTKSLAIAAIGPGAPTHSVDVINDILRFSYTTNTGAAFGMLPGGQIIFTTIAVAAVPLFLYAPRFLGLSGTFGRVIAGMMLGGTLGNLTDRILLGHVTDFIDMGIGSVRFWTYNIADASFTVSVVILAAYILFFAPHEPANEPGKAAPTEPLER